MRPRLSLRNLRGCWGRKDDPGRVQAENGRISSVRRGQASTNPLRAPHHQHPLDRIGTPMSEEQIAEWFYNEFGFVEKPAWDTLYDFEKEEWLESAGDFLKFQQSLEYCGPDWWVIVEGPPDTWTQLDRAFSSKRRAEECAEYHTGKTGEKTLVMYEHEAQNIISPR